MAGIAARLEELAGSGEAALVAYVMAGHPGLRASEAAVRGAVRGGADIVEIGYPFSDPLADGPVIQAAATSSLARGTDMKSYLGAVRAVRRSAGVPLVSMTYSNIFERHGYARLIARLRSAGIDGIILPDMPVDESSRYVAAARRAGVETVFLASPNTAAPRLRRIAAASSGFVYLVGVYGTTGARRGVAGYTLRAIRSAKRTIPGTKVGVGFGISTPEDVAACVRAGADAVIVGSPIVRIASEAVPARVESRVASYVARLKRATIP